METRARTGDIFAVALPGGTEVYGHVLLDIEAQCAKPELLGDLSPLSGFGGTVLARITRGPDAGAGGAVEDLIGAEALLPPLITYAEQDRVVGRAPVRPEAVDFPQALLGVNAKNCFVWGELWLPLAMEFHEHDRMDHRLAIEGSVRPLALHALGRVADIDPMYKVPEYFAASRRDLRLSPHGPRVHALLGGRIGPSYFETALRYGYDVRRFYGQAHRDRALILCPYCQTPFDERDPRCHLCKRDWRNDAPTEVRAEDLAYLKRESCGSCGTPVLSTCVVCPACLAAR